MRFDVDIDLPLTLCGSAQCFCWEERDGAFTGCVDRYPARVRALTGGIEVESPLQDEAFWRSYFDMERDYAALRPLCAGDDFLLRAYDALHGLHVLNQPVWDTLISFIISANNNVRRIKGLVGKLRAALGEPRPLGDETVRLFPTPEALASARVEDLRAMGMGYRAPYLIDTARQVRDGFDLEALRALPYDAAFKQITRLKGVGPKVADCVLLFSCGQSMAFPVDVWMERAMRHYMPDCSNRRLLKECAQQRWGDAAGILQQYLFHAARTGIISEQPEGMESDANL